jgi:hypothetical protein
MSVQSSSRLFVDLTIVVTWCSPLDASHCQVKRICTRDLWGAHRLSVQVTAFPVWNTRMESKGWQQVMFLAADRSKQKGRHREQQEDVLQVPLRFDASFSDVALMIQGRSPAWSCTDSGPQLPLILEENP